MRNNPNSPKPIILVAEDDESYRDTMVMMLRKAYGKTYEIVAADCLDDALEKYDDLKYRIHLIVTDNDMPDGDDGIKLLKTVRETGATIPILLNSGRLSKEEFEDKCGDLAQRANTQYMRKPFTLRNLPITDNLLTISSGRVLVIDGDASGKGQIAESLREQGYDVASAIDSEDALKLFNSSPKAYSFVLTETGHLNAGIDFVAGIRKHGSNIPAFFITDSENVDALKERVKLMPGNKEVLAKGYDFAKLTQAMTDQRRCNVGTAGGAL